MSPTMLVDEYEYRLDTLDLELAGAMRSALEARESAARRIRPMRDAQESFASRNPLRLSGPRWDAPSSDGLFRPLAPFGGEKLNTRAVYGTDERTFVTPTNAASPPVSAAVVLDDTADLSDTDCSAMLVGSGSAVTAAHCLFDDGEAVSTRTWGAGVVTRTKQTLFGTTTERTRIYGPRTGCYTAYLPTAWVLGEDDDFYFDIGVLDFRSSTCGLDLQPGLTVGYIPPTEADDSGAQAAYALIPGYDSALPAQSPYATWTYVRATLIHRSGSPGRVWPDPDRAHIFLHDLDTVVGSSGAGLIQNAWVEYADFNDYVTGINSGQVLAEFGLQNAVRRFDFFFAALLANAVDFQ